MRCAFVSPTRQPRASGIPIGGHYGSPVGYGQHSAAAGLQGGGLGFKLLPGFTRGGSGRAIAQKPVNQEGSAAEAGLQIVALAGAAPHCAPRLAGPVFAAEDSRNDGCPQVQISAACRQRIDTQTGSLSVAARRDHRRARGDRAQTGGAFAHAAEHGSGRRRPRQLPGLYMEGRQNLR